MRYETLLELCSIVLFYVNHSKLWSNRLDGSFAPIGLHLSCKCHPGVLEDRMDPDMLGEDAHNLINVF